MKTTREQKLKSLGTDESIGVLEFDSSGRKEKKEKRKSTKKIKVDGEAMMTNNEGRVGEKQKSGKKGHKEDTEDAVACKEEKVEKKQSVDNVMIHDDDNGQAENQQKKKRKKDKKDAILNGYEEEGVTEKRKKSKKDKKDAILNGYEEERVMEKKKKKKKDRMMPFDKETEVKNTEEEEETAVLEDKDESNMVREKEKMDATKADNKEKKKKEKKTKDDVTAGDEKHKEKVKEKKQNVKERGDEVEDCKETDGNKEKKKKEKKRKEKNTVDNMTAGDKVQKKKEKEKKEEGKRDGGKKRKLDTDDRGGEVNSEGQSTIKEAIAADSSKHRKPQSKKVRFSNEVNVYPLADRKTSDTEDGLVRGKRFTKKEDEAIRKAVYDYIEANHLGEEGLDMVLHCKKYRKKLMHCWDEIGAALPHRPATSVYYRAHNLFERSYSKWTQEEQEFLRKYIEEHGMKFKEIAQELGRHRVHVKDAWRRMKLAEKKRGCWSQDEYQTMFELVNKDLQMKVFEDKKSKHGMLRDNICWGAISNKLGTRLSDVCCMKWYNQLTSPMVAQGTWADADDYRLLMALNDLDASCEDEVDWDYLLEHRSGDLCRKRWKQMENHLGENGNKTFSEQVEVLSKRYCPDLLEVREQVDARPIVD